ncbi:PAS domain-containing protein [Ramlibacter pallidus]|uniref:PAS domain-containing protein n=1 Tax=Ramlibacter pallidus TaxID=2780087 RepID=A0ABR9S3W0_9BURK|nr:PAS domain-containing protein [Ramlibacter pallidus]MBE7368187.1 PAS domain-containing protein [Ramlibacter pallidus]
MGERLRAFDWENHPLGPPRAWPEALGMAMALCLNSSFPTAIYWGPDLHVLYNDAWSEIPAEKHPWILGKTAREGWDDIWPIVGPQLLQVMESGEGLAYYEQMLPMVRQGRPRETWWNYSFTPIRDGSHAVRGVFNQGNEVTAIVHARRERQQELARWHKVFQQAPAGIALLRGPTHVYEFANDAYLRVVGKTALVGKTVREGVPEVVEQGYIEVLDAVYAGKPFLGSSLPVRLQLEPGGPVEERLLDFVFQPVQDAGGAVDGIFILVTDVTDRARAESALRITNWQLGEERARLAATVEAEQRARTALRRMTETLEAQVRARTKELSEALVAQGVVADRLRTTFETSLSYQGFMDVDGTLRDANARSLADIRCSLADVVGRPFWETPWFEGTPGAAEAVRGLVARAARGESIRQEIEVQLPVGRRRFDFALRPVRNAAGEIIGLVPEAVELQGS